MTALSVRRVLDRILVISSIVVFTLLTAVVVWQVATRQLLHTPAAWTEEASRYLFIILSLLAATLVFSERGHIAVEVLLRRLPGRAQLVVGVFVQSMILFFAAYVFVFGGVRLVANAWHQSLVSIPGTVGQVYLVMPLAGILISFYAAVHLVDLLRGRASATSDQADAEVEV